MDDTTKVSSWNGAPLPRGFIDITPRVEARGCELLNGTKGSWVRKLLAPGAPAALAGESAGMDHVESSADDQLLLFMPFECNVKLHSIQLTSIIPDTPDAPMRPCTIKLFTNRSHGMDFDEADDTPPEQELTISPADWAADTATATLPLRFVKFQNVSSLVIYVVNGDGDGDAVRLDRVRLVGIANEARTGKIEKIEHDH